MQVRVTEIEAQLGNTGMLLYIADNDGKHQGKLRIGQATVEWCRGRTRLGNGKHIPMEKFLEMLESY